MVNDGLFGNGKFICFCSPNIDCVCAFTLCLFQVKFSGSILQIALWGSINTSIFHQSVGKFFRYLSHSLCCFQHNQPVWQFLVGKFVVLATESGIFNVGFVLGIYLFV
jgi:hypothetical protein